MTLIRSRTPSADESFRRHIRREQDNNALYLQKLVNDYLQKVQEFGWDGGVSVTTYIMNLGLWRAHVRKWNTSPMRLAELRESDFESIIDTFKAKQREKDKRNKWQWKFYYSVRSFIISVWMGGRVRWESVRVWVYQNSTKPKQG